MILKAFCTFENTANTHCFLNNRNFSENQVFLKFRSIRLVWVGSGGSGMLLGTFVGSHNSWTMVLMFFSCVYVLLFYSSYFSVFVFLSFWGDWFRTTGSFFRTGSGLTESFKNMRTLFVFRTSLPDRYQSGSSNH